MTATAICISCCRATRQRREKERKTKTDHTDQGHVATTDRCYYHAHLHAVVRGLAGSDLAVVRRRQTIATMVSLRQDYERYAATQRDYVVVGLSIDLVLKYLMPQLKIALCHREYALPRKYFSHISIIEPFS